MVWFKVKDLQLLEEIATESVLTHKQRSKERGAKWQRWQITSVRLWVMT